MIAPSHQPSGYACPFCAIQRGEHNEHNRPSDVVAVNALAFARINPKWWPHNDGSALVIPRAHHESLYDLPTTVGHAVWDLVREVAVAMRTTYGCDGISTRQHNEPAGGQDVWHLHVHLLPRYAGDRLYERDRESRWVGPAERAPYADRLAAALGSARSFD